MNVKLQTIKNAVTSKAGRQVLQAQKHSPAIMFGAGVVGVVATVVLASKATLRLEEVLDETEVKASQAKGLRDDENTPQYTERDYQQDMTKLYIRQGLKITKLYGPAFTVGTVSIGLLTGAHVVQHRRNTALLAAYATVDKAFKKYRERVIADLGDEKDREYRFGVDEKEVYSETKKGEPKVTRVKVAGGTNEYARFFQQGNPNWNNTPENNLFFLKMHQNYLNQQLQARGHVFLNEVYDALGMDRIPAGQIVGWVKDNPNGDGFIDFGIWDDENMDRMLDFMTGREQCILLDFNVDGPVFDQI